MSWIAVVQRSGDEQVRDIGRLRVASPLHCGGTPSQRTSIMIRLSLACLLVACGGDDGSGLGGRPGEFGQVTATPECGALSQACIGQGLDAPIALGSTLNVAVSYKIPGSSAPPITLVAADATVLETPSSTQLAAVGAGTSAVLFTGPGGAVIDLIHVFVQKPSELRLDRFDRDGELLGRVQPSSQLLSGDEILLAVEPYANGQPLLGNFDLHYTSSNTAVVQIVPDPVGGWYRVVARMAGHALVTFSALDLETTWDLEVLP
jgi:hypothetical protein